MTAVYEDMETLCYVSGLGVVVVTLGLAWVIGKRRKAK